MSKGKVLVVGDAGVNTGFERVVRGVSDHLVQTGWDVIVRGVSYYATRSPRVYAYPVKNWGGSATDPLAVKAVPRWIAEDKPDAVFLVQDLWHLTRYLRTLPKEIPTIGYFPVDTPNLKGSFCLDAAGFTEAVTYTSFGAREAAAGTRAGLDEMFEAQVTRQPLIRTAPIRGFTTENSIDVRMDRLQARQNPRGWDVIPHGLDHELFFPMHRKAARRRFHVPQEAFVVLNVNANQFRKRFDLTLRGFKNFWVSRRDAVLVCHCQGGMSRGGWDLRQFARYLGIPDSALILTHERGVDLTEEELRMLYSVADVQINTAGGEGWGLTAFEGAACGVPQLVPDWSATRELWRDHTRLLKVTDYRVEPENLNTIHAVVSVEDITRALLEMYDVDGHSYTTYKDQCMALAKSQLSWDAVGAQFATVIERALVPTTPRPVTEAQLLATRDPYVASELQNHAQLHFSQR